jgi:hypothetical protein
VQLISNLYNQTASFVNSMQKRMEFIFIEVLVNRLLGAAPIAVIIYNQKSILCYTWPQMHKFMVCRSIPVRIQAEQRDIFRRLNWDCRLDITDNVIN